MHIQIILSTSLGKLYFNADDDDAINISHYVFILMPLRHSLGGALAVLEALDLYQRDMRFTPNNLQVYTFGKEPNFCEKPLGLCKNENNCD